MTSVRAYPAPAKLNLFLHVVGRRADGYHLLQTVFTFVDYCDYLRFDVRHDGRVIRTLDARFAETLAGFETEEKNCEAEERPHALLAEVPQEDDLCVRAARLLQRATGCTLGVSIAVDKRIPLGAGLGGGSSDAATTLIVLNRLWRLGLPRQRLQALALELGADVPVFVFGQAAFAEGIGEKLQAVDVAPAWYVVLTPRVQVSTREVFASAELTRNSIPLRMQDFPQAASRNDLEPVVCRRYPEVAEYLQWLARFAPARMTGSGCAGFAGFGSRLEAERVFSQRPPYMRGFVAQGVALHPLKDFLS